MISIAVVATSAYLQWATRRRKRVLDAYNAELIELGLRGAERAGLRDAR